MKAGQVVIDIDRYNELLDLETRVDVVEDMLLKPNNYISKEDIASILCIGIWKDEGKEVGKDNE